MLNLREGAYYRTRDGRKAGPVEISRINRSAWAEVEGDMERVFQVDGGKHGDGFVANIPALNLISEWEEETMGPVRTVTRQEIVPGVYGIIRINNDLSISLVSSSDADELEAASKVLAALAGVVRG